MYIVEEPPYYLTKVTQVCFLIPLPSRTAKRAKDDEGLFLASDSEAPNGGGPTL